MVRKKQPTVSGVLTCRETTTGMSRRTPWRRSSACHCSSSASSRSGTASLSNSRRNCKWETICHTKRAAKPKSHTANIGSNRALGSVSTASGLLSSSITIQTRKYSSPGTSHSAAQALALTALRNGASTSSSRA